MGARILGKKNTNNIDKSEYCHKLFSTSLDTAPIVVAAGALVLILGKLGTSGISIEHDAHINVVTSNIPNTSDNLNFFFIVYKFVCNI